MKALNPYVFATVTVLLSMFLLVSWSPTIIQTASGDPAYTYAYHHLFSVGAVYGRDVIHTGGPWSILYFPEFYPDTFWLMVAGQSVFAAVIGWVLFRVSQDYLRELWLAIPFTLGSLALFVISIDARFFFIACMAIVFIPDFRGRRWSGLHLALLVAVACAASIKSSFLIAAMVVMAVLLVAEWGFARRLPLHALFLSVVAMVFHAAANQPLGAMPDYIGATFNLAAAYPEYLSELGSYWELLAYFALAVPIILMVLDTEVRQRGWRGFLTFLGLGCIFFLSFKNGFMRQDGQHVVRPFCVLLPFLVVYGFMHAEALRGGVSGFLQRLRGETTLMRGDIISLGVMAVSALCILAVMLVRYPSFYNTKLDRLAEQAQGVASIVTGGRRQLIKRHENAKAAIRENFPQANVDGSLAVYSSLQTVGLAQGGAVRVLPTTAAQLTWTPELDAMNSRFLSDEKAPDYVFGQVPYTNSQGGLALLQHYDGAGVRGSNYLMRRSKTPREIEETKLSRYPARWGERVAVPAVGDGIIRVRITYRRTLLGALVSFLYQPPHAYLKSFSGDAVLGRTLVGRRLANAGLLLLPGQNTPENFLSLATSEGRKRLQSAAPVTHILIEAGNPGSWLFPPASWQRYFKPEIVVSFERLQFRSAISGPR
ncbi:MAG: hypothetical protein O2912_06180 [Proteobacteria bacterium]|nr:hypothetical protein [Pseudomonadota bacterium]